MVSRTFYHLAACLYLILPGTQAHAQSAALDCNVVGNTMPVELSYRFEGNKAVFQSYRGQPGDYVRWTRLEMANNIYVIRANFVAGKPTDSLETTTLPGKLKSTAGKFTVEGMPDNFDRRSDLRYTIRNTATYADGTTSETVVTASYVFKSEEKITVNGCVISVIHGENDSLNSRTGKSFHNFELFFPELKLGATGLQEPVIDDLKTTFEPITPIP